MVLLDIPITEEEIMRAEDIFLPKGAFFDGQRREVLKSLDTIDINAVPGSGKTTVLLAKLFILAQRMPFKDRKGICVLTHTNVAIDDIKARLGSKADILFTYPNFFGTFQSFVDKYLAIPYYALKTNSRSIIINQNYYEEQINKQFIFGFNNFSKETQKNARYYLKSKRGLLNNVRLRVVDGKNTVTDGILGREINIKRPSKSFAKQGDFSLEEKQDIYKWIKTLKLKLLKDGVLCYDDAYYLAEIYINKFSKQLKEVFSNRFKYVFIDESQDTYSHQNWILENLFNDQVIIQRFGDPHQAIFDSGTSNQTTIRNSSDTSSLEISQSQRFGISIAEKLRTINVDENHDIVGSDVVKSLKPHVILFNKQNISSVLEKFAELIKKYNLHMPDNNESIKEFKAIGWRGSETEDISKKMCLASYFPNYNKFTNDKKLVHYSNLVSYIKKMPKNTVKEKGVKVYYDSIINGILRFLYIANIKNNKEIHVSRYFNKSTFMNYLKDHYNDEYLKLKEKIGEWSYTIYHGQEQYNTKVGTDVKKYLMYEMKAIFPSINQSKVKGFLEGDIPEKYDDDSNISNNYISSYYPEIEIKIDTVHGVKGETHKATLYLETFYKGIHDIRKILPFIKGQYDKKTAKQKTSQEALKIAYVGMSRPTHLLCIGINSDELSQSDIDGLNNNGWEIVRIN